MQRLTNRLYRVVGAAALTATTLTLQTGCAREYPTNTPAQVIETQNERRIEELREMVMATDARVALLDELGADAMAIEVDTDGGVLILEGYVTDGTVRETAEAIAMRSATPERIENRIVVRPDRVPDPIWLASVMADAELEAAVTRALMSEMGAPAVSIWVDAKDRVVTLHGTVDDDAQRQKAITIVRSSPGVVGVEDNLDTTG